MERIEWSNESPSFWAEHLYRYGLAASFVRRGDVALDAACGVGYGQAILEGAGAKWFGADKEAPHNPDAFRVDLNEWEPPIDYDLFVGLETIEHLERPEAYLAAAKRADRVVLSTPIVPSAHTNEFHVRDWTREEVEAEFSGWRPLHFEEQFNGVYGIWVFGR